MTYGKPFLAGFMSTLIFHQGLFLAFYLAGLAPEAPYSLARTWPFGVPDVLSLAFWGGVWAIPAWLVIRDRGRVGYWLRAVVFGALAPSAVALFVVFPLKGMGMAGGWEPAVIAGALILNGAWGFGVALGMRLLK